MAESESQKKKKSEGSKSSKNRTWSSTKILDCVAYFAVMFIALALILRVAFQEHTPEVASAFASIGECLAYLICLWLGFYWVMRQRNGRVWTKHSVWWLIMWIVATVVIVVFYLFAVL